MDLTKKKLTPKQALVNLQQYCAYQDRCHSEVRSKIMGYGVFYDDLEDIIYQLIQEDFLNEERFAQSFVRGRFRMKRWGRVKIQIELKKKKVSPYCIKKGFEEIEEDEYLKTLDYLIEKKAKELKALDKYKLKSKIVSFLIRKGWEAHLCWDAVNEKYK